MSDPGTTVDNVDAETLHEAQRLLGAPSPRDAVNQALRETVRRRLVDEYLSFMRTRTSDPEAERADQWR